MKPKAILVAIAAVVVAIIALLAFRETPLPKMPQSKRCAEMARRRDIGSIGIPPNASKSEVRKALGDPQNTDQDGEIWIWLFDWEGYQKSGLSRDWRTMSQNSGGHDGLWIGFDVHGRVRTPLWSLSAAIPPASDYNLNAKSKVP
jgi:hypothetical protein